MRPQGARALRGRVPCVGAEEVCSEPPLRIVVASRPCIPPLRRTRAACATWRPRIECENAAAPSRISGECGGISEVTVGKGLIIFGF